jgi:hypothetical protein
MENLANDGRDMEDTFEWLGIVFNAIRFHLELIIIL